MARLYGIVLVTFTLIVSAAVAPDHVLAGEWSGPLGGPYLGWYNGGFRGGYDPSGPPRFGYGAPFVTGFPYHYDAYHGTGCVWVRRPVPSPYGPVWGLFPVCVNY
jgi:hypothetical protein